MSSRIYDLHIGDAFYVYGCNFDYGDIYHVEYIEKEVATCRQRGSNALLMFPLNVAMPFAIRIVSNEKCLKNEGKPIEMVSSVPNLPEGENTEPAAQEQQKASSLENQNKTERIHSVIDYYRPGENWGKIHVDGNDKGIFFHISQVEDDELRSFLASMHPGSKLPAMKVSYVRSRNPKRNQAICAGAIHAEEKIPEAVMVEPVSETEHAGFISERDSNWALLLQEGDETYRTKRSTKIDPLLKKYLASYTSTGNLDSYDLKVKFTTSGRIVLRVEWANKEKVLEEQGVNMENLVSENDADFQNQDESSPDGEQEGTQKEIPVPAYRELPIQSGNN